MYIGCFSELPVGDVDNVEAVIQPRPKNTQLL